MERNLYEEVDMIRKAGVQIDFNYTALGVKFNYACVPWVEYLRMYDLYSAQYGKSQSAERIVERGGFGVKESVGFGYDNPLIIWIADEYPQKDSEWIKVALWFNIENNTYKFRIFTEEEYQGLDIFERIKEDYDKEN